MSKERRQNFCPACDRYLPADSFIVINNDTRPRCPECSCLLAPGQPGAFGPYAQELILAFVGTAARLLISAGLLDALAQHAGSEEPSDEWAAFLHARILLREAARL
jgi:hypothetical protein